MSCYYQNVRGLRSKCKKISENIFKSNHDIIVFTETWLNSSVHNGEIFDNRYLVFRRDRESSSSLRSDGGGSIIAINKNFSSYCFRRNEWESSTEDVWITVIKNGKKCHMCCVYIPGDLDILTLENFYITKYKIYL